ncbi:MAG: diguanylate cyclase [Ilumatobacteraceae bacterium]
MAHGVHIVDAHQGPLVGSDRLKRLLPFAATRTIAMLIAVPTSTWTNPALAATGSILIIAMLVAAVVLPWHRMPRLAQLTYPYSMVVGTLLLAAATGNDIGSPFITTLVVPLMWLALYEHRNSVLFAALLIGIALALGPASGRHGSVSSITFIAVLIVVCAGMGVTLHGLVADARKSVIELDKQRLTLEQHAIVLDALPERVSRYRVADHVITYCNPAWSTQYNVRPEQAIGCVLDDFLSEDEKVGLRSQLALLGPDNPILVDSVARATPGPDRKWLEWMDRYLENAGGAEVLSIGRDVTRRRDAELSLAETEAGFRDLADGSADVVWRFSLEPVPHFDYMSPSVESISGYPPSYFLDDFSRIMHVLDEEGTALIARALSGEELPDRFDIRFRHANGSINIAETRTSAVQGGLQGVSRDVTELRRLQDEMATLALRDPLTGLANRRLFSELLDADLARTQRDGLPLAIAFLDLDGLKNVNDGYGHDAGDQVLRETARRLRKVLRGADTVARIGGDEFVIAYAPNDANSFNLIPRIDRALAEPIFISETTSVSCPASIGVSDTSRVGYSSAALLAAADEAMYETKRARQAIRDADLART